MEITLNESAKEKVENLFHGEGLAFINLLENLHKYCEEVYVGLTEMKNRNEIKIMCENFKFSRKLLLIDSDCSSKTELERKFNKSMYNIDSHTVWNALEKEFESLLFLRNNGSVINFEHNNSIRFRCIIVNESIRIYQDNIHPQEGWTEIQIKSDISVEKFQNWVYSFMSTPGIKKDKFKFDEEHFKEADFETFNMKLI